MFGDLFEGDDTATTPTSKGNSRPVQSGGHSLPCPPLPRLKCGLAGIDNRGATCYMNALLQTLLLTPEFRESLFALGPSELGVLAAKDQPEAKVRVIPIQLQRLFGRLLLLDQQSASTEELTDSFGWQNNEEFQQHDVQELNRILFSAVEDSLIGTSGQNMISRLYHGICVNKIACEECGRVSEREEDFLDLTLAVAHYSGVEDTLKTCYVDVERMDGRNQYRCSQCNKLVDAVKSAKLRSLPPILTLSLLRFSFNYQKCERYKEIGKYTFPYEIDMSAYCEKAEPSENTVYELYSVLIHSGSTHGGHYHAYIKDVDQLGNWTTPEKEIIILPSKAQEPEGKVDLIELNSPQELLATLLRKHGGADCRLTIDKLCQALSEETGVSWNKRFKKKFGSVTKFVKSREEMFKFDARSNSVSLKQPLQNRPVSELSLADKTISKSDPCLPSSAVRESDAHRVSSNQQAPLPTTAWGRGTGGSDKHTVPGNGGETDDSHTDKTAERRNDGQTPATGTEQSRDENQGAPRQPGAAKSSQEKVRELSCKADSDPQAPNASELGQGDVPVHDATSELDNEASRPTTPTDQTDAGGDCRPKSDHKDLHSESERCQESGDAAPCRCPQDGTHWFDFNDSRVLSIDETSDLPRQFSGRESAYMLFYRRKSMTRTKEAKGNPYYAMPKWLVDEVSEVNQQLAKQREEYDRVTNSIVLTLLQTQDFEYRASALHRQPNSGSEPMTLTLDRRRSVADLKTEIVKTLGDGILNGLTVKSLCLHTAKERPAGLHLYNCVSENDSAFLQDIGVQSGTTLFVWDGCKIDGMPMKTGETCEPLLLHLTYAVTRDNRETMETARGFSKDLTIGEMRALVNVETEIPLDLLKISRVVSDAILIRDEEDGKTLEELGMRDGDRIIAEYKRKGKAPSLAANEALRQSRLVCLTVENRCTPTRDGGDWPLVQVDVDKDATVSELKAIIMSQSKQVDRLPLATDCRLRVSAYSAGLQPPLHESRKIAEVGIKSGSEVILEPGQPPKDTEICITFAVGGEGTQCSNHQEVILDKCSSVKETLELLVGLAGVTGDQWHLRKTNWFGEPTDFLQDPDSTLQQEELVNGCFLLLAEGRLPPKGFLRLPVWLYPSPDRGMSVPQTAQSEMLQWINSHIMEVIFQNSHPVESAGPMGLHRPQPQHALLGNVELSQDAALADLKDQIQTLPAMSEVALPSPRFMRLRLVEQGSLGRVLRDDRQTLRMSKVTSASHIAVQILQEEENLSSSSIVLNICQRIPDTRTYTSPEELIWDTARSATPHSLRQVIADRLLLPVEHTAIAKHLSQKFEWLVIRDEVTESKPSMNKGRGKRKGGGGGGAKPKTSLRQPPYSLKDGDTIGIKDLRMDTLNQDDFTTEEDIEGKKTLEKEAEERRKRRQELKENNATWSSEARRPAKKPEVGLTIRVADFR